MQRSRLVAIVLCSAAGTCVAQTPRVGEVDFYGLRKLTPAAILKATGIEPGGPLPPSKGDLEDKLETLPGVVQARVQAVCCDEGKTALFIGIEERGAPHASFRSEPSGEASLPQDLLDRYKLFLAAVQRAAAHGMAGEDLTAGHSMMDDPAARAYQPQFVAYAADHVEALSNALHNGSEGEVRAAAAAVLGYGPKTQRVADELQFAMDDPDPAVRANAMRALGALLVYASKHSTAGLKIAPTWFVELLHSVDLSDREAAAKALVLMTDPEAPPARIHAALDLIRERALPDLAEMARWPTLRYALPPFLLMGRLAGLPDAETQQRWAKGEREDVIAKALGGRGK